MNVLILGSGGREHALAYAVNKSKLLGNLYVAKGNPGINDIATLVDIDPMDNHLIKEFAINNNIALIIPGSEVYLENGISDIFYDTNIKVFGPSRKAAQIESSKQYAKEIMSKYDIPTAKYEVFSDYEKAKEYVIKNDVPIVIKYDGLAAGKGVVVAFTIMKAMNALEIMLKDKKYGKGKVVIEEYLAGPEFSLMAFVHNDLIIPMPIAQDHKRLLDNDLGPNTGGMGVYSPVPIIGEESVDFAIKNIMIKTAKALMKEKANFTGFLYGGLIQTDEGPKVIEFNARFGDPEAEVILPRLKSDILEVINALYYIKIISLDWDDDYHLGVVLASKGYPIAYKKNYPISGIDETDNLVFHMGTKMINNTLSTNGGRVLLVVGSGKTLEIARENAYNNIRKIKCGNLIYRNDIGYKSLKR